MLRLIAAAAAAVVIAASAMPAAAQDVQQVHVSFADLNLANPDGQATLAHRIARAVDEVCGSRTKSPFRPRSSSAAAATTRSKAPMQPSMPPSAKIPRPP